MGVYEFDYVGDVTADPRGVWEKTGAAASTLRGDGTLADVSAPSQALWWWDKSNCTSPFHMSRVVYGSGADSGLVGPAINCTDHENFLALHCHAANTNYKLAEYVAGVRTFIAIVTAGAVANGTIMELERISTANVAVRVNGVTLTSVATNSYNTIPYRGLYGQQTRLNLFDTYIASEDPKTPTAGKVNTKGNVAQITQELFSTGVIGKVNTRGNAATIGGFIVENIAALQGNVSLKGNLNPALGEQNVEAGNGKVNTKGNIVDIGGNLFETTQTGRVSINGNVSNPGGQVTITEPAFTGSVSVKGIQQMPVEEQIIFSIPGLVGVRGAAFGEQYGELTIDSHVGAVKINSAEGNADFTVSRMWVPDTTRSNSWTRDTR